jgi:signal transduction histidine kinase
MPSTHLAPVPEGQPPGVDEAALARREARSAHPQLAQERLAALAALSEAVNRSLDLDTVLEQALEQALDVLHFDAGDIRLLVGDHLQLKASRGVPAGFLSQEGVIPFGHCLCGRSAERGEVVVVDDLARFPALSTSSCACEQFRAVISVPVCTTTTGEAGRVVGLLHAASRSPREFEPEDRVFLAAIGAQVGAAVEKAQLHAEVKALNRQLEARVAERTAELLATQSALAEKAEQLRQMLVGERAIEERTRARVAHDLHDGVQQLIIGALFEIQAARESVAAQPAAAGERCAAAQQLLRQLEREMRAAIYSLRPVALDEHGLAPALRECVAAFERTTGTPCALHLSGMPRRLDPDVELVVFRIIQEALNNAEAHSRAGRLDVSLCFGAEDVTARVTDDGCGFDLASVKTDPRSHLGLIGMRQRAEGIGGFLDIWSEPGEGTQLALVLPHSPAVQDSTPSDNDASIAND